MGRQKGDISGECRKRFDSQLSGGQTQENLW